MSKAAISWLKKEDGGRIPPSKGTRYSPIIIFNGIQGVWSADFICESLRGQDMVVDIFFLSRTAPSDFLKKGNEFELFEGKKRVAKGIIL